MKGMINSVHKDFSLNIIYIIFFILGCKLYLDDFNLNSYYEFNINTGNVFTKTNNGFINFIDNKVFIKMNLHPLREVGCFYFNSYRY